MIIERINYALAESMNSAADVFHSEGTRTLSFGQDKWVGYVFGALFIIIGIACFFLAPRSRRRAEEYKQAQLEEYNKNRPAKRPTTDYSKTGLYLPLGQKIKMQLPVLFGVLLIIVGIAWEAGNSLTTL